MTGTASDMQVQRHAPIREQVATILRAAILDRRLEPGALLVERQLCEMTNASRPSVREALRQLEAEGLVESQNGRGTFVRVTSHAVAKEVYQVRAELEGLAAELFARNADQTQLERLHEAFAEVERRVARVDEDGPLSVLDAKNSLYDVIFEGSGNEVLRQTVSILQRRVNQLRAQTLAHPGRPAQSLEEIRKIVDAITAGDQKASRVAASAHVAAAARTVLGSDYS